MNEWEEGFLAAMVQIADKIKEQRAQYPNSNAITYDGLELWLRTEADRLEAKYRRQS